MALSIIVAALLLAACSSSPSPSGSAGSTGGTKQPGGTATWAEAPNTRANYIFPFMSLAFFSVDNINQFQFLMYRPLYWFGNGAQPTLNPSLSLAESPVYSNNNTTVVVKMKPYKWSNGETVTAQDIMFWMNMMHSDKANWAAYAPGYIPDNIKSITGRQPDAADLHPVGAGEPVLVHLQPAVADHAPPRGLGHHQHRGDGGFGWVLGGCLRNADASVTPSTPSCRSRPGYDPPTRTPPTTRWQPMPPTRSGRSWTGPGSCPRSTPRATSASSRTRATRARPSRRWPSSSSCPSPPTTPSSTPWWAGRSTSGTCPLQDVTKATTNPLVPAANNPRLSDFTLAPLYTWSINYFPENFNSTGDEGNAGAIWKQLYIRQAFQYLVDQPLYINKIDKGYGVPTYGPVPVEPPNPFVVELSRRATPTPTACPRPRACSRATVGRSFPTGRPPARARAPERTSAGRTSPPGAKLGLQPRVRQRQRVAGPAHEHREVVVGPGRVQHHLSQASFDTVIGNATACTPVAELHLGARELGSRLGLRPGLLPHR